MRKRHVHPSVELPTVAVSMAIHAGWLALTSCHHWLPAAAVVPLGALLLAWHGSLQHEAVHGHPTRWRAVNALLCGAPLSLWLPLSVYRESHLAHHRVTELTHPRHDPESFFVAPETWDRYGPIRRGLLWAEATLLGRLLLGPFRVWWRFFAEQARVIAAAPLRGTGRWLAHGLACLPVLAWLTLVCRLPLREYLALYVYPGLSLTLLRSFAEHRPGYSAAVVEAGRLWSLVFLYNNLHAVHHLEPGWPWYQLPARLEAIRGRLETDDGVLWYRGYADIARRFAIAPRDAPVHPERHA